MGQEGMVLSSGMEDLIRYQERFFTERVVRCWHRLTREVMDATSLEVFKARLDGALGSLV